MDDKGGSKGSQNFNIGITQPLFNASFLQGDIANQNAVISQSQIELNKQQLLLSLIQTWVSALIAKRALDLSDIEIQTNQSLLQRAKQSLNVGVGRIVDVAEAESAYRLALATQIQRQSEYQLALQNLSNLVGQQVSALPAWNNNDENINEGLLTFSSKLLRQNLNIKQALQQLQLNKINIKASRATLYPSVQVGLSYTMGETTAEFAGIETVNERDPLELSLSANWSYNLGGSVAAQLRSQQAQAQASRANLQATYNNQQIRLRSLLANINSSKQSLPALNAQLQAKKVALESYEQNYQLGTETLPNLLRAQSSLQQSQLSLVQTRYQLWSNYAELLFIINQLDQSHLQ